jgi:hypothetical protein
MIVDYKEIRRRIQKLWPSCRNIWLSDPQYEYPPEEELRKLIAVDTTEQMPMRDYQFDCDDFALQLSAAVSRLHGQSMEADNPWPFGQVMGREFKHIRAHHTCNICVLEDKIVLIEPQTDLIRIADSRKDKPFFVKVP